MQTYLARLFYLGTNYYGSQWQPDVVTVQGELVRALCEWSKEDHTQNSVRFSGRTDRGVHSYGQIVQFSSEKAPRIELINKHLPDDIVLWALCTAPPDFDTRNSVLARHYRYYLSTDHRSLDVDLMSRMCRSFIGTNDYALLSKPDDDRSTMTTILNVSLVEDQDCIMLDIIGTSFLWKLVRKIVSILVRIGASELPPDIISRLVSGEDVLPGGINPAPPESLVLVESIVPFRMQSNKIAVNNIKRVLKERRGFYHRTAITLSRISDVFPSGPVDLA